MRRSERVENVQGSTPAGSNPTILRVGGQVLLNFDWFGGERLGMKSMGLCLRMDEVNVRTVGHLASGRVQLQFWDFGSNCLVWSVGS
ncbi:hypothetical protein D5086_016766 [Populus alba]|uniref:Uncharacterized protein n=1 Tax=Populus alba TaxID=43335 RepID=A0ACC4BUW2_POPAL